MSPNESKLLSRFASGKEVQPGKIKPRLVEVKRHSQDELLFRYACLHWSIPVSSGYGRRLRFLVMPLRYIVWVSLRSSLPAMR